MKPEDDMDPTKDIPNGLVIGRRWEIDEYLGAGCTARVYKVKDNKNGGWHAIKIFLNDDDSNGRNSGDSRTKRRLVEAYGRALKDLGPFNIAPQFRSYGRALEALPGRKLALNNYYLVVELLERRLPGSILKVKPQIRRSFLERLKQAGDEFGYFLGDWNSDHFRLNEKGDLIHIDPDFGTDKRTFAADEKVLAGDFVRASECLRIEHPEAVRAYRDVSKGATLSAVAWREGFCG